ncbi:MAG: hypothetical protein ACE5FL_05880, partial [Myxococcota bacterium]
MLDPLCFPKEGGGLVVFPRTDSELGFFDQRLTLEGLEVLRPLEEQERLRIIGPIEMVFREFEKSRAPGPILRHDRLEQSRGIAVSPLRAGELRF